MSEIYRKAIASAFLQVCTDKKLQDITTKDITDHCGISRQTFYNYFHDKYEVMSYLFDEAATKVTKPFLEGSGSISQTIKGMMDVALNDRKYFMSIAAMEGQNSFEEYFCDYTIRYYSSIAKDSLGLDHLPDKITFAINFNSYAATKTFIKWIRGGMQESSEFISSQIAECMPDTLKHLITGSTEQ